MESQKIVPTLVKYANENSYLKESKDFFKADANNEGISIGNNNDWFQCVKCDSDGETQILAALMFRYGEMSFAQANKIASNLASVEKEEITSKLLGRLGEHDIPLRELEYASITFELITRPGRLF